MRLISLAALFCGWLAWAGSSFGAAPADAQPASGGIYESLVQQYMSGQWDEVEQALKAKTKELNALSPAQKTDVTYIRQNLAESRPAWWKSIKSATGKGNFRPMIWGRTLDLTFDPAGKGGVQTQYNGNRAIITVSWPIAEMDSTTHAEHGFSKGELCNLSAFGAIGMAGAWSEIPPSSLVNLTEEQKALLFRAMDFTGNLTGVYYGAPRARQWGLWLYMHSYLEKYAKMQTVNSRKAVAVAFLVDVLANPRKYPSIRLPDQLEAENAEEKLSLAVHQKIEKQGWTLTEDRSIREAIRAFAAANPAVMKQGGRVTFPSAALTMNLDPDQDAPLRAKRDAWFKQKFDQVRAAAK